jgi:hypothetical protein
MSFFMWDPVLGDRMLPIVSILAVFTEGLFAFFIEIISISIFTFIRKDLSNLMGIFKNNEYKWVKI